MKRSLLLVIFFGFYQIVLAQQWYRAYAPRGRDINDVSVLSNQNITLTGGNEFNDSIQSVFLSSNSGLSFDNISLDNVDPWLTSLAYRNNQEAIAVGFGATIRKSIDGALTWSDINSPLSQRHFNKIIYIDSMTAYIAGGWKTNDSLQTIMKSTDGGNSWSTSHDKVGPWLHSVSFADSSTGVAVGADGTILRTTTGGILWAPVNSPINRQFYEIVFTDTAVGYIVGGDTTSGGIRTILRTNDQGASWSTLIDEPGGELRDITFLDSDTGYCVGFQRTLLKTVNGGMSWSLDTVDAAISTDEFNSIDFFSSTFGAIVGNNGAVFVYTDAVLPEVETQGFDLVNPDKANVYGTVNTNGYPGLYWFRYSEDSTLNFNNLFETSEVNILSSSPDSINVLLQGLTFYETYYYSLAARTHRGIIYGDTLSFYNDVDSFFLPDNGLVNATLTTLPPKTVWTSSATVEGMIRGVDSTAVVSFDYGTTTAFGNNVPATPANISDTSTYQISANLGGLMNDQIYYYRLRAKDPNGYIAYGNTRQLYTGNPIPNWDFQQWETVTRELPHNWSMGGEKFEKVTGNSGNYALKLSEANIAILGNVTPEADSTLLNYGVPFNQRPDSLIVYANYELDADTAIILLQLTNNSSLITLQHIPISGNSGGQFKRLSFAIQYDTALTPDSLTMGFVSVNPFNDLDTIIGYQDNVLIVDEVSFIPPAPPLPNFGFEDWFEHTVEQPESWYYLKYIYYENLINNDTPMVSKANFDRAGDYAIELRNVLGGSGNIVDANVTSKEQILFDESGPAFPVYARHETFNGYVKFLPVLNDTAGIELRMYKNHVTIGRTFYEITRPILQFEAFSIDIEYIDSTTVPDSCSIELKLGQGSGVARFYVDKLSFDGPRLLTALTGHSLSEPEIIWSVFPNPASNHLSINVQNDLIRTSTINIYDLQGSLIYSETIVNNGESTDLSVSFGETINPGLYIIELQYDGKHSTKKILIL